MAAGPMLTGSGYRRKRNKNNGRGPGNMPPFPRGQKITARSKRMRLKAKA